MLATLYIKNYALIDEIKIDFNSGLSTITGETGAGKSIILGALSLVLGKRVDSTALHNQDAKCIIEANFKQFNPEIEQIFVENDLDFDKEIILRREITPSGKSRAFINDSPVNLQILTLIAEYLIDIHAQHQNIYLRDQRFLLSLLDKYSGNDHCIAEYQEKYTNFRQVNNEIETLKHQENELKSELDFLSFQLKELNEIKLENINLEQIETDLNVQENAEEILTNLSETNGLLENEDIGIINQLKSVQAALKKIQEFHTPSKDFAYRIESVIIELQDIQMEMDTSIEQVAVDPEQLAALKHNFNTLHALLTKHHCATIDELIQLKNDTEQKISTIASFDDKIVSLENEKQNLLKELTALGEKISSKRKQQSKVFEKNIETLLHELGIEKGKLKIQFQKADQFLNNGIDKIEFLFSSNAGIDPQTLSKIASGGEISRLMLSIKTVLSEKVQLPTIIFDEIDAGISGEIGHKMGNIMLQLAQNMQIISITHLPQIASAGNEQFTVEKRLINNKTVTTIRKLNTDERINEIAKLLSGSEITQASIENARVLLNQ